MEEEVRVTFWNAVKRCVRVSCMGYNVKSVVYVKVLRTNHNWSDAVYHWRRRVLLGLLKGLDTGVLKKKTPVIIPQILSQDCWLSGLYAASCLHIIPDNQFHPCLFLLTHKLTRFFMNSNGGGAVTIGSANGFPVSGGVPVASGEILAMNGVVIVVAIDSLIVVRPPVWRTPFMSGTPADHWF